MNDDPSDLERELLSLRPVEPSERLTAGLARVLEPREIDAQTGKHEWWQRFGFNRPAAAFGWGVLSPAAAVIVALIATKNPQVTEPSPTPPVAATPPHANPAIPPGAQAVNVLYQTLDEGVVLNGGQEPIRRVRYRSADRVRWHDPQSGSQWEVSYPREDVLLIPVHAE